MVIKYKDFSFEPYKINKISQGDWIDLRAAEDVYLTAGDSAIIPLGIAMKLPKGYEGHLLPRSSTFKKWGIIQTNGMGIIDNSYCGEHDVWGMPVYATRDTEIKAGDRICQFRIVKSMPTVKLKKVFRLSKKSRGGFGSTGSR